MLEQVSDVASFFGSVSGYRPCGCCGGFHAAYESPQVSPFSGLDADDRGDLGSNGKTSYTTTEAALQLTRTGLSWATTLGQSATVTYAFRSTAPTTPVSDTSGFARFSEAQIATTIQALVSWSDVANIFFQRAADGDGYSNSATMLFGNYTSGASGSAAFAYLPGSTASSSNAGDVWINSSLGYNSTPAALGYGPQVLAHEIGHALGLSHPAAYNAAENVTITYSADAVYYEDSRQYTIMSYFSETSTGGSFTAGGVRQYAAVPLLDDIAAAQRLYGANMTTRTGDTVYGFGSTADRAWFAATAATDVIFAIWDAGGTDTLDFSGYADNQLINLRQGAFSNVGGLTGNVAVAIGAVIENAIGGSGADRLVGNASDNRLTGGAGADTIDGGLGNDIAVFSGVRSAYTIIYSGNTATVSGPDGTDVLIGIESFQFSDGIVAAQAPTGGVTVNGDITDNTIDGTGFADSLSGFGGNDNISGQGGDDNLNGGTGSDNLNGGAGADILIGGSGADTLDGGTDVDTALYQGTAGSGVTVNLAAGTATGGDGADVLRNIENVTGSAFADSITGDAGANVIEGGGGSDTLRGGGGDDRISATGAPGQGGGAPDIVKSQATANGSIQTALNIDGGFDLLARGDVANATTIPHATVIGTTHGGLEYYAFTAAAGATVVFDIDGGAFDTTLRLFNAAGAELANNDDNNGDNGGATTDSQLSFTLPSAGTYYIQVGQWEANTGSTFTTIAPGAGQLYTLHVSVANHAVQPIALLGSNLDGEGGNDLLTGGAGGDTIFGGVGDDVIRGMGGNDGLLQGGQGHDLVEGGDGDDFVFGGQGADNLYGQAGNDFVQGNLGNDNVFGGAGSDTLLGGQGQDTVSGEDGTDLILGDLGDDQLHGNAGNDTLQGGAGSDVLIGGDGIDVASYTKAVALHYFEAAAGGGWRIYDGPGDIDTLSGMEWGQFGSAPIEALGVLAQKSFDAYGYMLGYADLLSAFRNNPLGAYQHYMQSGQAEGRVADSFDGLAYIASHGDLITILGANGNSASQHYALSGIGEGRGVTFSAANYLSVNSDLRAAFGTDFEAATRHYIQYGYAEGRSTGGPRNSPVETETKAPVGTESHTDGDLMAASMAVQDTAAARIHEGGGFDDPTHDTWRLYEQPLDTIFGLSA